MAKHICLMSRTDKGKEIRQYFIDVEKAWNTPEQIMARALQVANNTIHSLEVNVKQLKPKAEFYDEIAGSKDSIEMAHVAKVIGVKGLGRNKLFELLRDKKILDRNNIPYQKFVDAGYFRVLEQKYTIPSGETKVNIKTMVFQKGVDYIRRVVKEGLENGQAD